MNAILIQQVHIGQRLRRVRPESVEALAASIKEVGLLNPILVTPIQTDDALETVETYQLIAGHHRLEACKQLGMTEIGANIVSVRDVDQRLAEIDENLCRAELNQLERAEHLVERKSLYEQKYPETRNGAQGGGKNGVGTKRRAENAKSAFSVDTSEKIGQAKRTIQQALRRANNISQDIRNAIREVDAIADNASELDALASLKETEQKAAVQDVLDGKAKSIREAIRKRSGDTPPKSKESEAPATKEESTPSSSGVISPAEAQEWKRKAKQTSSEVLAAKERIRTMKKDRSALKARIKELESQPSAPSPATSIDRFHSVLDDIATATRSDPMSLDPQEITDLRNHLLRTVTVIEEMLTTMNQPFSKWGE